MILSVLITITGLTFGVLVTAGVMKALTYFVSWLSKK